jgi:hypothetical protein
MRGRSCGDCGSYHGRDTCPVKELARRQDPYGLNPPRPTPAMPSDPASRDANEYTIFLIPPKRIV